jgi:alkyl hydroperoxide reductase subunit AhpF
MPLLAAADQEKLRVAFAEMTRPVRLLFFTQTFGCETCPETRQILDELPALSDRIAIEEVNLVLEREKAKAYGIDRAPAIVVVGQRESGEPGEPGEWSDSRIRFLGAPAGYEFVSLVQAVLLVGGRASTLSEASRQRLAAIDKPIAMQVFTTPT